MFKLFALILLVHAVNVARGKRVFVTEGSGTRVVTRGEAPGRIALHCAAYLAAAVALSLLP